MRPFISAVTNEAHARAKWNISLSKKMKQICKGIIVLHEIPVKVVLATSTHTKAKVTQKRWM